MDIVFSFTEKPLCIKRRPEEIISDIVVRQWKQQEQAGTGLGSDRCAAAIRTKT